LKLTVDSNEPLEDAIRVVGSLYGVTLVVAGEGHQTNEPTRLSSRKPKKRSARTVPRSRAVVVTDARSRTSVPGPGTRDCLSAAEGGCRHR
jgi:hypothetical protein